MDNQPSPAALVEQADLLRPSAIRAAATLRVADHIAGGATSAEQVAHRCGARTDMMDILLRYVASLGLLRHDEDTDTYQLAEAGRFLLDDHPQSVRDHLCGAGLFGRADQALVSLVHTVRTGEPAHLGLYGLGYWETVNQQPEFLGSLERNYTEPDLDNADVVNFDAGLILEAYDWSRASHVVDVGGYTGALSIMLLRRHPHLRGTLLDLRNAATVAAKNLARAGLADRCGTIEGSFFDPLPAGGDVYLLSAILADWPDDAAVTILRRCGEAAGPAGRVLLAEVTLVPKLDGQRLPQLELYLRAMMPAPARSVDDLKELGRRAGLRVSWEGPVTPVRSLLEFTPEQQ
jgi:hypothetical protein